ncbi:hypothetical protein MMC14_008823 [Varicellaria rhodocarpa]|nr:hypothetical protein [Varicellaria rhodocarpa]
MWRPLSRIAFAVAIYPFQPSSPADLPLELGDELYIIEEGGHEGSWYRGYLVAPPSLLAGLTSVKGHTLEARVFSGIFPRSCVEVREVLGDAETDASTPDTDRLNGYPGNTNGYIDHSSPPSRQNSVLGPGRSDGSIKRRMSRSNGIIKSKGGIVRNKSQLLVKKNSGRSGEYAKGQEFSMRPKTPPQTNGSTLPLTPVSISPRNGTPLRPPAPVPMLKIGDETPTSTSEPLVDEIASCLREWHSTHLHELLLSRRYNVIEQLSILVQRVDLARRQLLHGVLTGQELIALREKTVWDLVRGNKMLNNEVIVRDPLQRGRLLMGEDSPIELARLQSIMSLLDDPPVPAHEQVNLHHILMDFKGSTNNSKDGVSLVFYLCVRASGETPRPLTESFVIDVPHEDQLSKTLESEKSRSLFTDLTSKDIGEGLGTNDQLYLVMKVYSNNLVSPVSSQSPRSTTNRSASSPSPGAVSTSSPNSNPKRGGRRSLMWAQSKLSASNRYRDQLNAPSNQPIRIEVNSSTELEHRPLTPASSRPSTQQGPQYVRKDIGVAVFPLKEFLGQSKDLDQFLTVWSPMHHGAEDIHTEDSHDEMIQDLLKSSTGRYTRSKIINGVHLHLQSFVSVDSETLIKKTPTLLHNIPETPKIGFTGSPKKARSDIYLTISEASIPANALFSHPERGSVHLATSLDMGNVQLTLEVRRDTGERIERCIFPSSNANGVTAWRTTAVEKGESWNQSIKLIIPDEDVPHAHLIMSVADAPGFPFALSWMPLWNQQTFIQDGMHMPLLYLYDKTTSRTDEGKGAYLSYPWTSHVEPISSRTGSLNGNIAKLKIETYLCNTSFSQDQVLLSILKWREQTDDDLRAGLKQLVFVPEIEVVKVVNDVFDALFSLLVDRSGNTEYESLVFSALVTVLGIVHDRRFDLGPLVLDYAQNRFNHPFATPCLIRSYLRLLSNPTHPENSRQLRATFKVGRQILRFIVEARKRQQIKESSIGITSTEATFNLDLGRIFTALESLMRDPSPVTIGSKTLLVQHVHTWLPELSECFIQTGILQITSNFLDACNAVSGKLILHKLVLILNFSRFFTDFPAELRKKLDERIVGWIAPYWGLTDFVTVQWREQVRLCCTILTSQGDGIRPYVGRYFIKALGSYQCLQLLKEPPKRTLSLLFPSTYPFPSKTGSEEMQFDESLIELSSVTASFLGTLHADHFRELGSDLVEILSGTFEVITAVLSGRGFPRSWLTLHVYHHRTILQGLEMTFSVMMERCLPSPDEAGDFDTGLWRRFFIALLKLVRSESLALETFPEQKRRAVWKIAGDIREQGAILLQKSWNAIGWEADPKEQRLYGIQRLGGFQVQYVPGLVASIVELCMSVHEGLRSVAIGVLQSMIISEWGLNEDLSVIQNEMIESFDSMFKSRDISESAQQKLFVKELIDLFEPASKSTDDGLLEALTGLMDTTVELIDLLSAVHCPISSGASRIMSTLQLMDFLKDVNKEDIFIRYVHQLAEIRAQSGNRTEAGLALRLHADLYAWESTRIVPALSDPQFPEQSAFERKECIYFEMIKHFEEGAAWDWALACYREIAEHYEHTLFDFAKLARAQRSMATIYETIGRGGYQASRYFRVVYRGLGFPTSLRDKHFVFQGLGAEKLMSFTDRLLEQHPAARVVPFGNIDGVEGQFLQIAAVSPYRDLEHPLYRRSKVPQSTRDYLLSSQPKHFAITSRRHSPKSGIKDQWIEKTVYATADSFPNIQQRSEIITVEVIPLSPLQTAIERTTRKTSELVTLENSFAEGSELSTTALTEAIRSSVDPSSSTSVSHYRELISTPFRSPDEDLGSWEDPPLPPLEDALKTAMIDHASMLRHCISLYSHPPYQSTQYALSTHFSSTYAPELALLNPDQHRQARSPQASSWLPVVSAPTLSSVRAPSVIMPNASQPLVNGDHEHSLSQEPQTTTSPPSPERSPHSRSHFGHSLLKRQSANEVPVTRNAVSSDATHLEPEPTSIQPPSSSRATSRSREPTSRDSHVSWKSSNTGGEAPSRTAKSKERKGSDSRLILAGTDDTSVNGGKGLVKKRLSIFSIGKKDGKGGFVSSLAEE